jgi:hypothetical protein
MTNPGEEPLFGSADPFMQQLPNSSQTGRIRELNDSFRHTFVGGAVMITPGIEGLPSQLRAEVLRRVRTHDQFDAGNDPHHEHDFGSFDIAEHKIFWKIDYFDRAVQFGSEDPADPVKTTRILTVMLASEY